MIFNSASLSSFSIISWTAKDFNFHIMKLSFAVLCTVAMGAFALPATVPREASGRLAIKVRLEEHRIRINC